MHVLLKSSNPRVKSVFRDALQGHGLVRTFSSWSVLTDAIRREDPRARVVVDPIVENGSQRVAPELVRLLRELPSTRVVGLADARRVPLGTVLELGRLGVAEIIDVGTELSPHALRARLDQVPPDAFTTLLDLSGLEHLSGRARLLLERAAEVASRGGYPRDLARRLGMGPVTLRRWMQAAGLPNPRSLFRWLRVLLAASLLDDPGRTVSEAANASGYSDASGLRRAMNAVTGRSPSQLRDDGAYESVLGLLAEALDERG